MGLFDKAESRVERHTSGLNKNVRFNEYGKKIFNIPEKEKHENVEEGLIAKIIEGPETVKEELSESEKRYREMNMQKVIKENTNKNFLQSLGNKTKLCVLENVLSSIYYDALYLDDDFKEYNRNVINESVHNFLDERGGYKYIEETYYKNKSPLLREIMRICEETSTEINKRKIEESKNAEELGHNLFNFNMTPEEEKKLDYSKEQIGLKQISNVIKDKVLTVVKEERKRESEHEELLSEIENELSDNPEIKDPEAVAEALNKIFVDNVNIEEGTLFNSLLRNGLKSVIESGYESLDLIKEEVEEDISNDLDKLSLENIIAEAETHEYDDEEIYNDKMQELYDDMLEKVEEGKSFGKNNEESLVYAFDSLESKMDEITDTVLELAELEDIRRDFRLIQEAVESYFLDDEDELEEVEEGCKEKCKNKCKDDEDDDDDEYDDDEVDDDDEECEEAKCGKGKKKCKESSINNVKTIDTTFENDFRYIIDVENPEDFVTEAKGPTAGFTFKNLGTIYSNMFKAKKDITRIQPGLMKMVGRCKTMRDIDYLYNDIAASNNQLTKMIQNAKDPAKKKQLQAHQKWINSTYKPAVKAKRKELKDSAKMVKECAIDVLESYINKIDEKIDMHMSAKEFADNEVYVTENYERFIIPIINKSDSGLDGLKIPYKMKAVLETLLNTIENYESCDNIKAVKKVINTNKENVNAILESYKGIPSTPLYKVNYFHTFDELLDIVDKQVDELLESYEYIDISDGDYEGGIQIYDDDFSFKMITESITDDFNPDEVNTIDMDYILADTIAKYTLMETMYTINLESYTYNDIKKMTTDLLNKK